MPPPNDFAAFILTHGRPDNVKTYATLKKCGYTGPVFFIVDNEDATAEKYIKNFGADRVKIFDKKAYADSIDEGNNFDERRVIVHARNACFDIAREIGVKYFIELDDDYYYFGFRFQSGARIIKNLDAVFSIVLEYYKGADIASIAFGQGGDHIGGFSGIRLKRKCMNSFICSADREFRFVGAINEDVNTYTALGGRGRVYFTFTGLQLDQKDTQTQAGGMSDSYASSGTYIKSFHTVMMAPSCVSASMMNTTNPRIHHSIKWANAVPVILREEHKKGWHEHREDQIQ